MKDPKFPRFYFLPKIHKRLHNVLGRPTISNRDNNGFHGTMIPTGITCKKIPL